MFFAQVLAHKSLISEFIGSEQNKIVSKSLKKQMKGFSVAKVVDTCPDEKLKKMKKSTFISTKQDVSIDPAELIKLLSSSRTKQKQNNITISLDNLKRLIDHNPDQFNIEQEKEKPSFSQLSYNRD